jgi:hypothetical protein
MKGPFRIYFNCREDAPNVWSWDTGPGTEEMQCANVVLIGVQGEFKFDPTKHLPEPSAWLEIADGRLSMCGGGEVRIYGEQMDESRSGTRKARWDEGQLYAHR